MIRLDLTAVVGAALLGMLACRMPNPAFDQNETENNLENAEVAEAEAEAMEAEAEAEAMEAEAESQTGDGDPTTTGDGDPTTTGDGDPTTTGDGDGDPTTTGDGDPTTTGDGDPTTTGDGDGDPTTTGDGDPTTGDGDGEPIQLDMMMGGDGDGDGDPFFDFMIMECALVPNDQCQMCAANNCCVPGAETCFQNNTDCWCILQCMDNNMGDINQCANFCQADFGSKALVEQFKPCMEEQCALACP